MDEINSNDDYKKVFSGNGTSDTKTIEAFKFALDTRKFEIELYWKRTTYFWAFIAATFTGFGLVSWDRYFLTDTEKLIQFFLACFGFLLSFAWFFANKGSKQWQENWEYHVDNLENEVTGPLYKTVLKRLPSTEHRQVKKISSMITGPSAHSVSKINQIISLYITVLWLLIIGYTKQTLNFGLFDGLLAVITLATAFYIAVYGQTSFDDSKHYAISRKSKLVKLPEEKESE